MKSESPAVFSSESVRHDARKGENTVWMEVEGATSDDDV